MSDDLSLFERKIEAERGNIYTYDGRILATTIPTFELRMDTKAGGLTDTLWNKNIDSLCIMMASVLPEKSAETWKNELTEARNKGIRHMLLARKVPFQSYQKLKTFPLFRLGKNKSGLIVIQNNTRKMPFGMLAQRTIGYIRDSGKYKVGIEGRFNEELSGENKEIIMQKVAGGVYMPVNEDSEFGSKPGLDIYTTLDVNLQDVAENSLLNTVKKYNADHGSVVLMNIKTGEIKAIANIGKMSNNTYGEAMNYAVGEANEPGSVMKLASVMALLDEGFCDENTMIDFENGKKKYYDKVMNDAHPVSGTYTLAYAFKNSSNVGISKPVFKHFSNKKELYYNKLEQYHLTKPLGIGISGEKAPIIKSYKDWTGVSLPWLAIGYEIQVTPMQILALYAAVANNGTMMKPYLVREIKDNNEVIESFQPEVLNKQICKSETLIAVRKMLESVVDSGTASNIRNSNYKIAGKTGTNLIASSKHGYKIKKYQASFVGYFPANNPVYAGIVVINDPDQKIDFYGSGVAAPVFKDIADRLYTTDVDIHPTLNRSKTSDFLGIETFKGLKYEILQVSKKLGWKTLSNDSVSDWSSAVVNKNRLVLKPNFYTSKRMPNLKNMGLKDAIYLIESMGGRVIIEGKGKVIGQSLMPGEIIYKGTVVKLNLG